LADIYIKIKNPHHFVFAEILKVTIRYGILKSAILPVVTGQMTAFGVGYTGASLLKFIPGVGTIAGGIIDSSFALSMTLAVGLLYLVINCKINYKK
jgi:uncharacterized protein (DUF697 family)